MAIRWPGGNWNGRPARPRQGQEEAGVRQGPGSHLEAEPERMNTMAEAGVGDVVRTARLADVLAMALLILFTFREAILLLRNAGGVADELLGVAAAAASIYGLRLGARIWRLRN